MWAAGRPVPDETECRIIERAPIHDENRRHSPRYANMERNMQAFQLFGSYCRAIHNATVDEPEEDVLLLDNSMFSIAMTVLGQCDEYFDLLTETEDSEKDNIFAVHEALLRVLQWQFRKETPPDGSGGHWVLKTPAHMFFGSIKHLHERYPDATFVWTHRDPASVIASALSLMSNFHSLSSYRVDVGHTGEVFPQRFADSCHESMEIRRRLPAANFVDVQYQDLVSDPVRVVERIYASRGCGVSPRYREALPQVLARLRQNKFGKHRYTLEQFGLTREAVRETFGPYITYCRQELGFEL
mmetsp:Transcript_19362/g.54360  ORF Transcript_19362/g.54360 Transcript_19362/m.54360 type:complete len:299 (-) Transcript_19362:107-1003(-)